MSFGAIGYFHKNKLSTTDTAIKTFKKYYPESTVVMINDGGNPGLEEIAKENNCIYMPYERNVGNGNDCDDIEVMIEWVNRFLKAVNMLTEEYCLILEDDVTLLGMLNTNCLTGEMNGYNPAAKLPEKATEYLKKVNSKVAGERIHYGGCGGCVLKTEFFKKIYQSDWIKEMFIYADLTKRAAKNLQSWYHTDTCISYLCWLYGGNITQNPEWLELQTQNYDIETAIGFRNGKRIFHKYKKHY